MAPQTNLPGTVRKAGEIGHDIHPHVPHAPRPDEVPPGFLKAANDEAHTVFDPAKATAPIVNKGPLDYAQNVGIGAVMGAGVLPGVTKHAVKALTWPMKGLDALGWDSMGDRAARWESAAGRGGKNLERFFATTLVKQAPIAANAGENALKVAANDIGPTAAEHVALPPKSLLSEAAGQKFTDGAGRVTGALGKMVVGADDLTGNVVSKFMGNRHAAAAEKALVGKHLFGNNATHWLSKTGELIQGEGAAGLRAHAVAGPAMQGMADSHAALTKLMEENAGRNFTAAVKAEADGHIGTINGHLKTIGGIEKLAKEGTAEKLVKEESKAAASIAKNFGKVESKLAKVAGSAASSHGWGNLGAVFEKLPAALGRTKLGQLAIVGTVAAGAGAAFVHAHQDHSRSAGALEKMARDLGPEGQALVEHARTQSAANYRRAIGIGGATSALDALTWGGMGMSGMVVAMPAFAGLEMLKKADTLPLLYEGMEKAKAAGQTLPPQAYAMLLCAASPKIAEAGADNGLVATLAGEFAKTQTAPAAVLKDVISGRIDQRATTLAATLAAEGRKAGEKLTAPMAASPAAAPAPIVPPVQAVAASPAAALPVSASHHETIPGVRISQPANVNRMLTHGPASGAAIG